MSKCPKCGKEIESLLVWENVWNCHELTLKDNNLKYEHQETEPSLQTPEYECPRCREILFLNELKAKEFLKGKKQ